jgi:hypothetical protein
MRAQREVKGMMYLENRDPFERAMTPGLNNWIIANGCNRLSSFMQGKPIHGQHASEISHWRPEGRAMEILEGDSQYALVEQPFCFSFYESKPEGVGGYWFDLWHVFDEQGPNAEYFPMFVPLFFEKNRKRTPPPDWEPDQEMVQLREDYAKDWMECKDCGTPLPMRWGDPGECFRCASTRYAPIILTNEQLFWYYKKKKSAEDKGEEALKKFFQEMPVTPEQGFQHSGKSVFGDDIMFRLQKTCRPGERGFFDDNLQWHAARHCKICRRRDGSPDDHFSGGPDKNIVEEFPCQIWELPREGATYVLGCDVAEGLETGDFSCIHVLKIGYGETIPDTQVCEWWGHIDGIEFARICYVLGKSYNTGMLAIDAYGPGYATQGVVMHQYAYPNIYRWKHLDSFRNIGSNKAGVWPNYKTKRAMITIGIRWLRRGYWEIRSQQFLKEAPFFVKDEEESLARAEQGQYDDCVMAALFAIYAAHEDDYNPMTARFDIPLGEQVQKKRGPWIATCTYGHEFECDQPGNVLCPHLLESGKPCGAKPEDGGQGGFLKTAQLKSRLPKKEGEKSLDTLAQSLISGFYSEEPKRTHFKIPKFDQL